jgi:DNA-directed RNA polymerase specialized sigma24 family protein
MLQIGGATCTYAASVLRTADPAEAREAALFTAGQLEQLASALRTLTAPRTDDQRALAAQLAGLGWSTRAIAERLGVSPRAVRRWLAGERAAG